MGIFSPTSRVLIAMVFTIVTILGEHTTSANYRQQETSKGSHQRQRIAGERIITYNCNGTDCSGNVCRPIHYKGPTLPEWCKKKNSFTKTNCDWSTTCWGDGCEVQSNCNQATSDGKTFEFSCFGKRCRIRECDKKEENVCKKAFVMSSKVFEDEYINKLPKCKDVDEKEEPRTRRNAAMAQAVKDYCCELNRQWSANQKSGVLRAKRGKRS